MGVTFIGSLTDPAPPALLIGFIDRLK